MFDVFTEEIEILIRNGMANLYWYKDDLKRLWLQAGVDPGLSRDLFSRTDGEGKKLTKYRLMNLLYDRLRTAEYDRRLEISRNFVRILIEHNDFLRQDSRHNVEKAEVAARKLKDLLKAQRTEQAYKERIRRKADEATKESYYTQLLKLRQQFLDATTLEPQKRGYELEKIFSELMRISGIPVEKSFKITGEQIDGGIKYDGHYYLVELKWVNRKCDQNDISSLYVKSGGKLETRGIFIAMNGYSDESLSSLPTGKELKVLLFDGVHLANAIHGVYHFQELLEHAISQASYSGVIYCSRDITA
jgi:restriction endonuclease